MKVFVYQGGKFSNIDIPCLFGCNARERERSVLFSSAIKECYFDPLYRYNFDPLQRCYGLRAFTLLQGKNVL